MRFSPFAFIANEIASTKLNTLRTRFLLARCSTRSWVWDCSIIADVCQPTELAPELTRNFRKGDLVFVTGRFHKPPLVSPSSYASTEEEFFGAEFFDGVSEFGGFFEFEFFGGFAHVGF